MSTPELLVLGAIAGSTIFLGLPIGRLREPRVGLQAFLNALAIGILVFLLYDVLAHAVEPVNDALTKAQQGHGTWLRFSGLSADFAAGLGVGLLSLAYFDNWRCRRVRERRFGPGAASVAELSASSLATALPGRQLALLIATGIGLHHFSEGLAIGQSAAKGEISLAVLLVVGFGLHNATEGFGIVAPLTTEPTRPSWGLLGLLGLIGGGPTFLGTIVGQAFVNAAVSVAFLTLAAGSILFVVVQLLHVAQRMGHKQMLMWGLLLGLLTGFATDFVITAAGV
jgi:ZIP family zinc transporter